MNTVSQTSQMIGDFYGMIGRTGSICTLKVDPRRSSMVVNFKDKREHEVSLSVMVANGWRFLREV